MNTYEFTFEPKSPGDEKLAIIPVDDDGTCPIPGTTPADPEKTFHDIRPGDYLIVHGAREKIVKVRKLE